MNCFNRHQYIEGVGNQSVLNSRLEQAIADIQDVLFSTAQSLGANTIMAYKAQTPFGVQTRYLTSEMKVCQLSEQDWCLTVPRHFQNARGIQDCLFNKILLKRNNWCRKTMIHEALHSLSIFNSEIDLRIRFPILEEGITEFLTGYVLFRKYSPCYSSWKSNTFQECSMSSSRSVRRFYAFCNFVSVKSLINLYFWQRNRTWEIAWSQFLTKIHASGYPNFRDVTELYGIEPTEYFFEECANSFGPRFRTLYSSRVDYDSLVIDE